MTRTWIKTREAAGGCEWIDYAKIENVTEYLNGTVEVRLAGDNCITLKGADAEQFLRVFALARAKFAEEVVEEPLQ